MTRESPLFKLLCNNEFSKKELNNILLNYENTIILKAIAKYDADLSDKQKQAKINKKKRRENFFNDVSDDLDGVIDHAKQKYKKHAINTRRTKRRGKTKRDTE